MASFRTHSRSDMAIAYESHPPALTSNHSRQKSPANFDTSTICRLVRMYPRRDKIWAWLTSPRIIEMQIQFLLFCSHALVPFERYYDQLLCRSPRYRKEVGLTPLKRCIPSHRMTFARAADANDWDWRGLPKEWLLSRIWQPFSTSWMLYAWIKTSTSEQIFPLVERLVGWPGHCIFLGRLISHPATNGLFGLTISSFHIVWRFMQHTLKRSYKIGSFMFMLQTERDLKRFMAILSVDNTLAEGSKLAISGRRRRWDPWRAVNFSDSEASSSDTDTSQTSRPDAKLAFSWTSDNVHEYFLTHLLCYQVEFNGIVYHKLRPNRTWTSRAYLANNLALVTIVCSCIFLALAIPIGLIITYVGTSTLYYVQTYPGCDPNLDRLYASGQIRGFAHELLDLRALITLPFTAFENLFVWVDSAVCMTFVPGLVYLMNSDILLFWHHLHARVEHDLRRVKHYNLHMDLLGDLVRTVSTKYAHKSAVRNLEEFTDTPQARAGIRFLPWECLRNDTDYRCLDIVAQKDIASNWALETRRLNEELNELQYELFDFFLEVSKIDRLVGDIITATILIWLSGCAMFSFYFSTHSTRMPLVVELILIMGQIGVLTASYYVLRLNKCCLRTYGRICSLTARTRDISTKRRFIKVLEFYNDRQLMTYKLFNKYPYLGTTYITIMGYSLSCVGICYAIFGRTPVGSDRSDDTDKDKQNYSLPKLGSLKYSI